MEIKCIPVIPSLVCQSLQKGVNRFMKTFVISDKHYYVKILRKDDVLMTEHVMTIAGVGNTLKLLGTILANST